MGKTMTQKILATHSCRESVETGELVNAKIDLVVCHDVTTTPAIDLLEKHDIRRVFDPERIVITPDHFVPNKDIDSAELVSRIRRWAKEQGIKKFFEVGRHGICHALVLEQGFVRPGMTVVSADSHACTYGALGAFSTGIGSTDLASVLATGMLWFKVPETMRVVMEGRLPEGVYSKDVILETIRRIGVDGANYKAMEFCGEAIEAMSVEARMTVCNMAIEAGAKSGVMPPDKKTFDYVKERTNEEFRAIYSDEDAAYCDVLKMDVSDMEPLVAFPHLPSNGRPIGDAEGINIDQAYLGSCTNGSMEDLRIAASLMKGRKVAEGTRMIVVPATTEIWRKANGEGLLDIFAESGAAISTPTCGACLGGHMGVLAEGEKCISSTNRNFVGRMGSTKSEVFLASPATVAASAIRGQITDPRRMM